MRLGDDEWTRGRSWRVRRGPGKANCAKKSGEKGLMYLWSRNHLGGGSNSIRGRWIHLGIRIGEIGALWGEGREQETTEGLGDGSREREETDGEME